MTFPPAQDHSTFSIGACLSRMRHLYRRDWKRFLLASVGFWVFVDLVLVVLDGQSGAYTGIGIGVALLSATFVSWSGDAYRAATKEEQVELAKRMRIGAIIATSIVTGLATILGLLLLVLPGVLVGTLWSLHQPTIVREGLGFSDSLRRSWQLVRPRMWSAAGCWLIVIGLWLVASVIAVLVAEALGGPTQWDEYGWQNILADAVLVAPVFPTIPLTAAAMYDLLAARAANDQQPGPSS